jgi:hypothetical protein
MAYRTLTIDSETWEYVIGQQGVKMRSPTGKCTWKRKYELLGYTKDEYYDLCRDTFDADDDRGEIFEVGPGVVKRYIENNIKE